MTTHALGATSTPRLLRIAEDELQRLRGQLALVAAFIHDPTHDPSARHALARLLHLPRPATPSCAADETDSPHVTSARPPTAEPTLPPSRNNSDWVLTPEGTR
ncbi:hypothetical protein ACFU96_44930 [Streptomyces sp. NPDC057620]|uniref:hypothetical protein n=1 Tax=Streptomyces sp. NPDC057620 TaxID=3346185 RepID=UPI0036C0E9FB